MPYPVVQVTARRRNLYGSSIAVAMGLTIARDLLSPSLITQLIVVHSLDRSFDSTGCATA